MLNRRFGLIMEKCVLTPVPYCLISLYEPVQRVQPSRARGDGPRCAPRRSTSVRDEPAMRNVPGSRAGGRPDTCRRLFATIPVGASGKLSDLPLLSHALHIRFKNPDRWRMYREFVRCCWYGREVKSAVLSLALKRGTVPTCPDEARIPRATGDEYWWDQLTMDAASLTDPLMRRQA